MLSLKKPRRPPVHPHIRVLSLSSATAASFPGRYARGVEYLRSAGYQVTEGASAREAFFHMAGPPEARVADLLAAWRDPGVDIILSVIGGHSTAQILDAIPFAELRETPKVVVGYSDTTSLLTALYARAGIVTFYGPALMPQFGEAGGPIDYTLKQFERVALGNDPRGPVAPAAGRVDERLSWDVDDNRPRTVIPGSTRRCFRPGSAEGVLVPANIGTLLSLAATPFFPNLEGAILVAEEDDTESPDSVDRFFTQLRQSGILRRLAGLVVGRFPAAVRLGDESLDDILRRATEGTDLPVLVGFEAGHVDPICTLPLGIRARLDAVGLTLHLLESPFSD